MQIWNSLQTIMASVINQSINLLVHFLFSNLLIYLFVYKII